jgi:hypothetical protein
MGDDQAERDESRKDPATGGGSLPVSDQADNAETVLDPDMEAAHPEREAAEHAERLEGHSVPTDTPAHRESPARPKPPPDS